jgi:hypothetical protein
MYYMLLHKGKKKSRGAGAARTAAGGAGTAGGAVGTTTGAGGAASKKAKVMVVQTVEKAMTRIAAKKQKKQ